jgi:CheY-like chemotaxis protein
MKRRLDPTIKPLAGWKIVIVDDTPDNLSVAEMALRFNGAEVMTAGDGEAGMVLLKSVVPTVILLDIRMPKMDGWTMFRALKANPETAQVPVIAVTAYAMDSDREEILAAGFDGYISKPFDIFTLVGTIRDFVAAAQARQTPVEDVTR